MLSAASPLTVVPVEGARAVGTFIRVPWSIYADDPAWVPPLLLERRHCVSRRRPYFAHAVARFWVAYRGRAPVGRISAQVDRLHLERYDDATGFFGMLEAENDGPTFEALFGAAEAWLRAEGMRRVLGPFNLSINEECGLLVAGFDTPPMILMGHGRPYYAARVEEQGYRAAKDLLAYRLAADFTIPDLMRAAVRRAAREVVVRPLQRSRFRSELSMLREVFEDAWSENWGFVPFTAAEFEELGRVLRFVVDDDFVQIAELGGEPVGMLVLLPNLHEAIRDLNGRLRLLGWPKLAWRLGVRRPRTGRVALMGVRKRYQRTALGLAIAFLMIDAVRVRGRARGIREVELSWVLEDNQGVRSLLEAIGSVVYKRYRLYEKPLR
ncbi:MAG: DNA-binding protein [Candidatus Rokubacteria bacterium RIFCSPLOWO2_12_FULL_71_22]|nr:MAG: DNA-binding protein [Candidatus Rokubacteria bacterium RIFCSPLOWO2_12_FULL_71_22]